MQHMWGAKVGMAVAGPPARQCGAARRPSTDLMQDNALRHLLQRRGRRGVTALAKVTPTAAYLPVVETSRSMTGFSPRCL